MPSRSERRRQARQPDARPSFLLSREVLGALALGLAVVGVVGAVLLLSGGGDDPPRGPPAITGAAFSPSNDDEAAIAALAQRSISAAAGSVADAV
jgi:hypothetical protein